ncbi:MAG: hypothetical protein HFK02_04430 [Clostridia bacterium]|nr:hypothetical protein [Clostridia bacterium]
MDKLIALLSDDGGITAIAALATVILTGIIKLPLKKLAEKFTCAKKITRFIVFLPLVTGFGMTTLINFLLTGQSHFDAQFFMKWLSAVSLSLAIYAFWEKFVPSEKKFLTETEIQANKEAVEKIKESLEESQNTDKQTPESETIILTNRKKD